MKMVPEDLSKGIDVIELKPRMSEKLNYWNGVHRLESDTARNQIVLKTTTNDIWIEWHVAVEETPLALGLNVKREPLSRLRVLLSGGKFSVEQDEKRKVITFYKGQLFYRIDYETPDDAYPEPAAAAPATAKGETWRFQTNKLAEALKFIHRFIDDKGGNADKTCATLHGDGTLITGRLSKVVMVEGVCREGAINTEISFISLTAPRAKLVADFLSHLGPIVELTVSNGPGGLYEFREPESGNRLVVTGTEAQFKLKRDQFDRPWTETAELDREFLLVRAKAFGGVAAQVKKVPLLLTFRGETETGSLQVSTMEQESDRRCSDEVLSYRTMENGKPAGPTTIKLEAHDLQILSWMKGRNIKINYDGKIVKMTEVPDDVEESPVVQKAGTGQEGDVFETEAVQGSEGDNKGDTVRKSVFFPCRRKTSNPEDQDTAQSVMASDDAGDPEPGEKVEATNPDEREQEEALEQQTLNPHEKKVTKRYVQRLVEAKLSKMDDATVKKLLASIEAQKEVNAPEQPETNQ
jgi:hypothetical protein